MKFLVLFLVFSSLFFSFTWAEDDFEVPPPLEAPVPLAPLPKSLPWISLQIPTADSTFALFKEKTRLKKELRFVNILYYLVSSKKSSGITILEKEDFLDIPIISNYLYLASSEDLKQGELLTVLTYEEVKRKGIFFSSSLYIEKIAAIVRVERLIKEGGVFSKGHYSAKIVNVFDTSIKEGDSVIRKVIPRIDLAKKGRELSLESTIFAAGPYGDLEVLSNGDLVYLNAGENKGFRAGDVLSVYNRYSRLNENTQLGDRVRVAGHIKLFSVEDNFSTALITSSREPIYIGAVTGPYFK